MVLISFLLFILVINTMTGTAAFHIWSGRKKLLEQKSCYFRIYTGLKSVLCFFLIPGPVWLLVSPSTRHILKCMCEQMEEISVFVWLARIIICVWVLGVFRCVAGHLQDYMTAGQIMHYNMELKNRDQTMCFEAICRRHDFFDVVCIYENEFIDTPMIVGPFKNQILFPVEKYSDEEFEIILEHEIMHAKHRDLLYKECFVWLQGIFWFLPVSQKALQQFGDWCETACDISVCTGNTSVWSMKQYFEPMLNHLPSEPVVVKTALALNTEELELMVRMKRMKKYEKPERSRQVVENIRTPHAMLILVLAVCVVSMLMYRMGNYCYVSFAENNSFFSVGTGQRAIEKSSITVRSGKDGMSGWHYLKAGTEVKISFSLDFSKNTVVSNCTFVSLMDSNRESVSGYYAGESAYCHTYKVQESGFYCLQFANIGDAAYRANYQICR